MLVEFEFAEIGYLPHPEDNCAVSLVQIEKNTICRIRGERISICSTIPVGHRFATRAIRCGSFLTSWNRPFGISTANINPGDYILNEELIEELNNRDVDFEYPKSPNFANLSQSFPPRNLEPVISSNLKAAGTVNDQYFLGYNRGLERGVGTRNHIAVLPVSSHASSFSLELVRNLRTRHLKRSENFDGFVALHHTEGGGSKSPNNLSYLLRTLAGFIVHPNIGSILIVDTGFGPVTNRRLKQFLNAAGYPLDKVMHEFMSISPDFTSSLTQAQGIIESWLDTVISCERSQVPVSALKIALQCGGSDSFSGISANPLVGEIARRLVELGGTANLAETDELVGAENYVLSRIKSPEIVDQFIHYIHEFSERMSWHGHSPEGNPSGGNRFRGLYNIALKSLGAAMKKHPEVAIDSVIDYSERMTEPGFFFMNSPGNDLESIAGQVAAGSNLILFTTGNGSVTNFPFVPTIKVISTSKKYSAQEPDMDINAGRILDGFPFDQCADESFELVLSTASGQKTKGELAGHSQVSIWRDWIQDSLAVRDAASCDIDRKIKISRAEVPTSSKPIDLELEAFQTEKGVSFRQLGLIFPTSLCSSQVSCVLAERLNQDKMLPGTGLDAVFALPHTEGCGVSSGHSQQIYEEHLFGYLKHPDVAQAVLIEHGCEKVHLEYVRKRMAEREIKPDEFGWFSVQGDGGTERMLQRAQIWFIRRLLSRPTPEKSKRRVDGLKVGLVLDVPCDSAVSAFVLELASKLRGPGGALILTGEEGVKTRNTDDTRPIQNYCNSLSLGESVDLPGLYWFNSFTNHPVEIVSGLGALGVHLILVLTGNPLFQGHLFIPTVLLASPVQRKSIQESCFDFVLSGGMETDVPRVLELMKKVLQREIPCVSQNISNCYFQITRGPFGISV